MTRVEVGVVGRTCGRQGHCDVYWQGQGRKSNGRMSTTTPTHTHKRGNTERERETDELRANRGMTYLDVTHGLECRKDEHKAKAQDEYH